jgi:hypothetical protein
MPNVLGDIHASSLLIAFAKIMPALISFDRYTTD